ncbi:MAG: LacI family DNA-binding transcriptional regulator [Xanthobacteraceae bacterium]
MKNYKRARPTLRDIAREVGVHVSTISRALNPGSPHAVSPDLAEKIRRASQRRGYRRNAAAYLLKTSRSRSIGVIIPDITDPVFPPIIRGIEDGLAQHDYVAILANTDGDARRQMQNIAAMRPRGIDGLILASVTRHDPALSQAVSGTPVVTISRQTNNPKFSSVVHDEEDGIGQILTHLVSLGHRQIATIAGPQAVSTGFKRYSSFVRHAGQLGLDAKQLPISFARAFNEKEGDRCAEELLASRRTFTALACANDRLAVGAIAGFRRHGIECPKDISVTGFNDMMFADCLLPPLTTVRVHHHQAGVEAARMIVDIIENAVTQPQHIVLPVELIVRGSTGAPDKDHHG